MEMDAITIRISMQMQELGHAIGKPDSPVGSLLSYYLPDYLEGSPSDGQSEDRLHQQDDARSYRYAGRLW
jgi:hypothetical protein